VQGLAEFLPISSSAHLALMPWLLHWQDPGLAFDVALHWGTLAAVLAVFWQDWIRLIRAGLLRQGTPGEDGSAGDGRSPQGAASNDIRLFWALVVSAIPGAIIGKLLDKWAEENLRAPLLIACTLGLMGVILWIADRVGSKSRQLDQMSLGRSLVIGIAQAAALIPGVSRSGSTITVGLLQGFDRESIARFSFLMSTPIIFGAGLLKLPHMLRDMRAGTSEVTWGALAAGFVAAAIVGTFVIRWMLNYLRTRSYAVFAGYRVAVAIAVVLLWFSGHR
jgi:undecaprenyl-diphosphatase